jgi:hypothetical protein
MHNKIMIGSGETLGETISTSQGALSEIQSAMLAYRKTEQDLRGYQLELVEQEVSDGLQRAKMIKRAIDLVSLLYGDRFASVAGGVAALSLGLTGDIEEQKKSLIKRLEESLGFLTTSREDLERGLAILFEAWEAYVAMRYTEAATKAQHSRELVDNSLRSCLIGTAKESIRRVEAKVSMGKRIFAKVKDARKALDSVKSEFTDYDTSFPKWNVEAKIALENIIKASKSAEIEAQYSMDDAKLPFLLTVVLAILALVGGAWTVFNIIRFILGSR